MTTVTRPASATWQLDGSHASLCTASIKCSLDLANGTHEVAIHAPDALSHLQLWQLHQLQDLPLTEAYVRLSDLVACYGEGPAFPFHTDIYWTVFDTAELATALLVLQLIISVRTDRLETHPELDLVSTAAQPDIELISCEAGRAVRVVLNDQLHLAEFATDEDSPELTLVGDEGGRSFSRRLFGHFLEKGVIRRARLFAAVIPAETSPAEVRELCDQLAATKWPLTV